MRAGADEGCMATLECTRSSYLGVVLVQRRLKRHEVDRDRDHGGNVGVKDGEKSQCYVLEREVGISQSLKLENKSTIIHD